MHVKMWRLESSRSGGLPVEPCLVLGAEQCAVEELSGVDEHQREPEAALTRPGSKAPASAAADRRVERQRALADDSAHGEHPPASRAVSWSAKLPGELASKKGCMPSPMKAVMMPGRSSGESPPPPPHLDQARIFGEGRHPVSGRAAINCFRRLAENGGFASKPQRRMWKENAAEAR